MTSSLLGQARLITRAMRHNGPLRSQASKRLLSSIVREFVPEEHESSDVLVSQIGVLPDDEDDGGKGDPESASDSELLPEVLIFSLSFMN